MSTLETTYTEPGDTVTASVHDNFLDDLATLSAALTDENFRSEALGLQHLDMSTDPIIASYGTFQQTSTANSYTHSGTSFQKVGYSPALDNEVTGLATAINDGDVIEIAMSVLTYDPTITADTDDYVIFRHYVTTAGGGATAVGPRMTYSLQGSDGSSSTANNPNDQICQNRHTHVYYHIWQGGSDVLTEVSTRAVLSNASNSIDVVKWNISARVSKH